MKKYAVITGGSVGIGYSIAKRFGQDNYKLYLVDKDEKELKNPFDINRLSLSLTSSLTGILQMEGSSRSSPGKTM